VQHGRDLLGRGLAWGGIAHAVSDSDECGEKGGDNAWKDIGFLAESTCLLEIYER
jgi:hypothetical protein